jgi:hypothetical protein
VDELVQILEEERSLYELLFLNWSVPLPMIGLASFLMVFSEVYCLRKGGSLLGSYAVTLYLMLTGLGGVFAVFITRSIVFVSGERSDPYDYAFHHGDRLYMEPWYYPSVVGLAILLSGLFIAGAFIDLKKKHIKIVCLRSVLFTFVLYLSVSVASIPYQLNNWFEHMEDTYEQRPSD